MSETPIKKPKRNAGRDWRMGVVSGGFFVMVVGLGALVAAGLVSGQPPGPLLDEVDRATAGAYPSAPPPGSPATQSPVPRVVVLPGIILDGNDRIAGYEAVLRLHTWLGLRDLRTGRATIAWEPAVRTPDPEPLVAADCEVGVASVASGLSSPADPPDSAGRPRDTLLIRLALSDEKDTFRLEAFACRPGGRIHRQMIRDRRDRLGRVQRELVTWLATRLEVGDTTTWETDWGRSPAPAGPLLTGYARALRTSMGEVGLPEASLSEAAEVLPEAAWLSARLATDPSNAMAALERAVALRVGFTAGLEDLAALHVQSGRVDLAEAAVQRLRRTSVGSRPVEWPLAWALLREGRPAEAASILRHLPEWLLAEEATARLWATALAAMGEDRDALHWVNAWRRQAPQSGEAQFLHGAVLEALEENEAAGAAYLEAAQLDAGLKEASLIRWARLQFEAGTEFQVERRFAEDEWIEGSPALLELRAFATVRSGKPAAAAQDYAVLVERVPDDPRHRLNLCSASLAAGLVPATPDPCADLPEERMSANLLAAAAISRIPDRSVLQFIELMDRAERAGREAPLDPIAADAVLQIAGPFRQDDERARLQGMWRLAVGGDRRFTASEKPEEGTEDLLPAEGP